MKQVVLVMLMIAGPGTIALSDPPSDIILGYDLNDHLLRVDMKHGSRNIHQHYVSKVTVFLNGNQIIQQQFKIQFNHNEQKALYFILAKKGDEIAVTGTCVIYGQKTVKLTVRDRNGTTTETGG